MNRSQRSHTLSLAREIEVLDEQIAALVGQRTRLLAKAASSRKRKRVAVIDPGQEKRLWSIWSQAFEQEGLDKRHLRKLFLTINSLAYAQAENKDGKAQAAFCMYPRKHPLHIDIQGPRDTVQTRVAMALAASCPSPFTLRHFQTSDVNIALLKALNQAGASLSWDRSTFISRPAKDFSLDGKVIFCGHSLFNLFLLICQGLARPGQIKFTGSAATKLFDLRPIQTLLPQLGARLIIIDPHSHGLPVRLETAGHLPSSIEIPQHIEPSFVLALAATAPLFPKGMTLILGDDRSAWSVFTSLTPVLNQFDIPVRQEGNRLIIPSRQPVCQETTVTIPIDYSLGSYLLALPFFREGRSHLQGTWVGENEPATALASLLTAFGMTLQSTAQGVESACCQRPDSVNVNIGDNEALLPLATAMCLGVTHSATLTGKALSQQRSHVEDFLQFLGVAYTIARDRLDIRPSQSRRTPPDDAWESPSPLWTVAYVMASFVIPGICLANPGELTAIWPDFWTTFNNLPRPQDAIRSEPPRKTIKDTPSHDHKPKRIKISKH